MYNGRLFTWIFTGIWSFVGLIFLAVGAGLLRVCRQKSERCALCAQGTVRELASQGLQLFPVIDYQVYGKTYSVRGQRGYQNPPFAIGDAVEVHYNGDNPSDAYVDKNTPLRLIGRIFFFVGIGAIVFGCVIGFGVGYLAF